MYVIPLVILFLIAVVAVAWSPLFAVIIAAVGVVLYLTVGVGMRPRSDQEVDPPTGKGHRREDEGDKGLWGERRK